MENIAKKLEQVDALKIQNLRLRVQILNQEDALLTVELIRKYYPDAVAIRIMEDWSIVGVYPEVPPTSPPVENATENSA